MLLKSLRTINNYVFLTLLVLLSVEKSSGQSGEDTISLFFATNSYSLNPVQQNYLDSLQYAQRLPYDADILIVGYADFVGSEDYNLKLSQERAVAVKKQVLLLGYKESQIRVCVGKGEVERSKQQGSDGYAPDRKVDVVMLPSGTHKKREAAAKKLQGGKAENMVLQKEPQPGKYMKDLVNTPVKNSILLDKVHFLPNSHKTTSDSEQELAELYGILAAYPDMMVRIEGHICCVTLYPDAWDEDAHNYTLSVNRAKYIYQYLVDRGIPSSRLSYMGFGRDRPIAVPEVTEEDMTKNRRVEVRVLRK